MDYEVKQARFTIGQNLSNVVDLGDDVSAIAIGLPGTWTAANLTFRGCDTAQGEFTDIHSVDGSAFTVTTSGASRWLVGTTLTETLRPFRFIKIRSGTLATPVTQAGDNKVLKILVKSA